MRRVLAAAALALALSACGGSDAASPTATPQPSYEPGAAPAYQNGGILGPAGDARNTVDQLNDLQERTENETANGP